MINGAPPAKMPFLQSRDLPLVDNPEAWFQLRPLTQQFSFDSRSGEIRGLMWGERVRLDDGERKVMFNYPGDFPRGLDSTWLTISMRNGLWLNRFDVVAGDDVPQGFYWVRYPEAYARVDPHGKLHVLLIAKVGGTGNWPWDANPPCAIGYLTDKGNGWSAPINLGSCQRSWGLWSSKTNPYSERSLAFADQGEIFASWIGEDGVLLGRWLSPASSHHSGGDIER